MKKILLTTFLFYILMFSGCAETVSWIGTPVTHVWENTENITWKIKEKDFISIPGYEIGFRSDGVVVWREIKGKNKAEENDENDERHPLINTNNFIDFKPIK